MEMKIDCKVQEAYNRTTTLTSNTEQEATGWILQACFPHLTFKLETWFFYTKFGVHHSWMNLFQVDIIVRDELCGAPLMYCGLKYLKALRMNTLFQGFSSTLDI